MRLNAAPSLLLALAALVAAFIAFGAIYAALSQPWTGLALGVQGERVVATSARGPAAGLPWGVEVERLSGGGQTFASSRSTSRPNRTGRWATTQHIAVSTDRRCWRRSCAGTVEVQLASGTSVTVIPEARRPVGSLPAAFWVQLAVGLIAWAISASVFAFRRHDRAAPYLLFVGRRHACLRAICGRLFRAGAGFARDALPVAQRSQLPGGSLFCGELRCTASQLSAADRTGLARSCHCGGICGLVRGSAGGPVRVDDFCAPFRDDRGVRDLRACGLALVHVASRAGHARRAAMVPVVSVVGTGLFALFILLPQMFGVDTSGLQGFAFLLFLLVYGGSPSASCATACSISTVGGRVRCCGCWSRLRSSGSISFSRAAPVFGSFLAWRSSFAACSGCPCGVDLEPSIWPAREERQGCAVSSGDGCGAGAARS